MQFGKLTTPEAMEDYFQRMRAISRDQILGKLYPNQPQLPHQSTIEADLTNAFMVIIDNYNFDMQQPIVKQIVREFEIEEIDFNNSKKDSREREKEVREKIHEHLKERLSGMGKHMEEEMRKNSESLEENAFDWVGIKSNFQNLKSIFQEILLEKVRLFDDELSKLTHIKTDEQGPSFQKSKTDHRNKQGKTSRLTTKAQTFSVRNHRLKSEGLDNEERKRRLVTEIDEKGFTNVLIRDHSEFALSKWTRKEEKDFKEKMQNFRRNFHKTGQKSPIIFQFVKQFTKTVKARDNIYHKFENREKVGISPEELKYLCSTSLFLNKTLNLSEKNRLNKNIHAVGKDIISKLEFNISEKIIETYKKFMKKVQDLRAHYYEELTEQRKLEYSQHCKKEQIDYEKLRKKNEFLKYKCIFENICKSQKMKIILNPRVARWVKLFIVNLRIKSKKPKKILKNKELFDRLNTGKDIQPLILKSKMRCPATRVIKRQEHTGYYRSYFEKSHETERFFYDRSFERHIQSFNSIKVKNPKAFRKQLTGGPRKEKKKFINVDLTTKTIHMSSKDCLRAVVMIQSRWRAIYERKRYCKEVQDMREREEADFQYRKMSLKRLYPAEAKIDLKMLQDRLKRVSMRNFKSFQVYQKVTRKPINLYTSFCSIKLSLNEMKRKNILNTPERMNAFGKMVQANQYAKILKSGYVLTAKEINQCYLKEGASLIWWAVKNSNIDLVRIFLEGGGNPNSRNVDQSTCLHEAIQNGDLELIFMLLDYGGDLSLKNNRRQTPKYFATQKMLKWLGIEEPADEISRDTGTNFFNSMGMSQNYW